MPHEAPPFSYPVTKAIFPSGPKNPSKRIAVDAEPDEHRGKRIDSKSGFSRFPRKMGQFMVEMLEEVRGSGRFPLGVKRLINPVWYAPRL
jgi:hypothetical protein